MGEEADVRIDDRRWNELKRRSLHDVQGLGGGDHRVDDATARRDAWLFVLDLDDVRAQLEDVDTSTFVTDAEQVDVPHKDEEQVALDVRRSFIWLGDVPARAARRTELAYVINGVLRRHPCLRYYQGYHDVVSVLLLVLVPPTLHHDEGQSAGTDALDGVVHVASRVSLHVLRDVMTDNMTPTMGHLKLIRNIVRLHAPMLSRRIELASPLPYFALPWLLSVFAHDVDVTLSYRLFDYVLLRGPMSLLYLCAAVLVHMEEERSPQDDEEEDAAELHQRFSHLPSKITHDNLSAILQRAERITSVIDRSIDVHQVMGDASVLFTWRAIPWSVRKDDKDAAVDVRRQAWSRADQQATQILLDRSADIVRDAMPSPPAIEQQEEYFAKPHNSGGALMLRRWWSLARADGQGEQRGGTLVAWIGAFGALGAAMWLVYGTSNGGVTSTGIGTAFPVGLRASSDTFKQILRLALPAR